MKTFVNCQIEQLFLYVPEGLNVRDILKSKSFVKHDKDITWDEKTIIDFIHAFIHIIIVNSGNMSEYNSLYSYISHERFRKIKDFPSDIIDFLEENLIIRKTTNYLPGKRSYGYRLTDKYVIRELVGVAINTVKVRRWLLKQNKRKHFLQKFYNGKLSIEVDSKTIYEIIGTSIRTSLIPKLQEKKVSLKNYGNKINDYKRELKLSIDLTIKKINQNIYPYSVTQSGRHFNILTNCKSELRRYVKYDNEPLYEIDIKNAAPYFLLYLLDASKEFLDLVTTLDQTLDKEAIILMVKNISDVEKELYTELVLNGTLYEFLGKDLEKSVSRDIIKKHFYFYIYNKNDCESKIKSAFELRFPKISKLFAYIKKSFNKTRSEGRRSDEVGNVLCLAIYYFESHLVIELVAKKFHVNYPNIPIFTVHDCLITNKIGVNLLKSYLIAESEKLIGYPAPISLS